MRRIWLLSAVSLTMAWNSPAKADFTTGLIDVDFKFTNDLPNMTGPAVIGSVGDIWNSDLNSFAHTTEVLNLTTGIPSNGVNYSLSGTTNAVIGAGGPPGATFMGDGYIVSPGNTMMISVNGLTPFQPYDLYFYSSFVYPPSTDIRITT